MPGSVLVTKLLTSTPPDPVEAPGGIIETILLVSINLPVESKVWNLTVWTPGGIVLSNLIFVNLVTIALLLTKDSKDAGFVEIPYLSKLASIKNTPGELNW